MRPTFDEMGELLRAAFKEGKSPDNLEFRIDEDDIGPIAYDVASNRYQGVTMDEAIRRIRAGEFWFCGVQLKVNTA